MTYTVLHGEFVIRYPDIPRQGPQPDGDTVKFAPSNPGLVERLPRPSGGSPKLNSRGISVRLEAIDALETHFMNTHQELDGGMAARDAMLSHLGFSDVEYYDDLPYVVRSANADRLPGWVISNGIDAHGRLIGFCFTGTPPRADGLEVFAEPALIDQSANVAMLNQGLVYPAFYTTLPPELRTHLTDISRKARAERAGLWARSVADPDNAATVSSAEGLTDLVMWPKLFRRLVPFFATHNNLSHLDTWLREDPKDRDDAILMLETGEHRRISDIVTASGDSVQLTQWPEDFVILPDGTVPGQTPAPAPHIPQPSVAGDVVLVAALPDPVGRDRGNEIVTLLNLSGNAVDLTGWSIVTSAISQRDTVDETKRSPQALKGELAAGQTITVTLNAHNPLGNSGGSLVLRGADGAVMDRCTYHRRDVATGRTVLLRR